MHPQSSLFELLLSSLPVMLFLTLWNSAEPKLLSFFDTVQNSALINLLILLVIYNKNFLKYCFCPGIVMKC